MLLLSLARLISARQELNTARLRMEASRNEVLARHDDEARAALSEAGRKITGARHDLALPPIRVLSAIPLVGSPWRAAGDAAAAGKHGVAAGRVMIDAASSFPNAGGSGLAGHDVTAIHAAITKTNVALVEANAELAAADRDLAGARHAVLPVIASPARAMSGAIGDARTQLQSASRVVSLLNTLLDPAGDHRFLLLAQDTLEARPTGGFIGSFGVLHVAQGKLTLERYEDSRTLPAPDPPLDPPPDLAPSLPRYWGLSNTDWWPDFPTSASVAKEMFKRQGGGDVDGVISVTEHLLGDLVGVLGPIQLPDYDKPVVEDGFDQRVVYEVELKKPPDVPQKKFLILLAKDVLDRLFSAPPDKVPDLAKAFGGAASSGDLQIWMADPKLQNTVLQTGVSGALPRANQDFVMLTDANVEASKANAGLVRTMSYRVDHRGDHYYGHFEAIYENQAPQSPTNPFYLGYLRLYVPAGARLLNAHDNQFAQGTASDDGQFDVFAQYVQVDPLTQKKVVFDYQLPDRVAPDGHYQLVWARQAGAPRDTQIAVIRGRTYHGVATKRSFVAKRSFNPSGIRGFLHSRAMFRRIGL